MQSNGGRNILRRALFNALFLTLIFFANPFGLRTATEKYSEDLIISFLSPWYPAKHQNEVTIILLDDSFMQEHGNRYPVEYPTLRQLLRVIGNYQPKAVFFDLLQHYEHSDGLESWFQQIKKSDFPVYMASSPAFDTPEELEHPDSLRHKLKMASAKFTAVSWSGSKHYYPLLIANESDQETNTDQQNTPTLTAALSLYREWCKTTTDKCQNTQEEVDNNTLFQNAMVVRWSNKTAPKQEAYLQLSEGCQQETEGKYKHLLHTVISQVEYGFSDYEDRKEQQRSRCFNMLTLSATSLVKPGAMNSSELRDALKSRIVMVGYNLIGSPDDVQSPLHGKLPGVFFHAMALDNLINLGDEYWHVPKNINGAISISDYLEGFLQCLVSWLVFTYRYSYIERAPNSTDRVRKSVRNGLLCLLGLSLVSFVLVKISIIHFKLGPMNWFALTAVVSLAVPTFLYHKLTEIKTAIKKLWQREDNKPLVDGPELKVSEGEHYENAG